MQKETYFKFKQNRNLVETSSGWNLVHQQSWHYNAPLLPVTSWKAAQSMTTSSTDHNKGRPVPKSSPGKESQEIATSMLLLTIRPAVLPLHSIKRKCQPSIKLSLPNKKNSYGTKNRKNAALRLLVTDYKASKKLSLEFCQNLEQLRNDVYSRKQVTTVSRCNALEQSFWRVTDAMCN